MGERTSAKVVPLPVAPHAPSPLQERADEALMALAAADHRAAFEAIVARHLPRLAGYCAKFVGNPRVGEEIAQEVLIETWAQRARYRAEGRFPVFLLTHARGEARRRRWEAGPVSAVEAASERACAAPDQLDALLEEERRRRVRVALLELPPKLREAALLRFDQGLAYAEIGRIIRRPEPTARSRVFLALQRLRAALAEEVET
jgi:RNA polymerase sigma-70 factor (ECF subfamily)